MRVGVAEIQGRVLEHLQRPLRIGLDAGLGQTVEAVHADGHEGVGHDGQIAAVAVVLVVVVHDLREVSVGLVVVLRDAVAGRVHASELPARERVAVGGGIFEGLDGGLEVARAVAVHPLAKRLGRGLEEGQRSGGLGVLRRPVGAVEGRDRRGPARQSDGEQDDGGAAGDRHGSWAQPRRDAETLRSAAARGAVAACRRRLRIAPIDPRFPSTFATALRAPPRGMHETISPVARRSSPVHLAFDPAINSRWGRVAVGLWLNSGAHAAPIGPSRDGLGLLRQSHVEVADRCGKATPKKLCTVLNGRFSIGAARA